MVEVEPELISKLDEAPPTPAELEGASGTVLAYVVEFVGCHVGLDICSGLVVYCSTVA